jgi:hypothetical protein
MFRCISNATWPPARAFETKRVVLRKRFVTADLRDTFGGGSTQIMDSGYRQINFGVDQDSLMRER